jgi:hypothetical protein
LQADEIAVVDAGMKISDLQEAGLERYELRLAVNFTARRNVLPEHERGRKPTYGAIVRPLARKYKDKTLAAKQMVGAHRQFVSTPESIQRLPELALLAGSILTFLAATAPTVATGFWDRQPKRTPGRFRRTLIGKPFPNDAQLSGQIRKKNSQTAHLPKGILARTTKMDAAMPCSAP